MKRAEALRKLRDQASAIKAMGATGLYLFGSTARDEANAQSDVDLFIDHDPRGRFNALDVHPLIREQVEAEATRVF